VYKIINFKFGFEHKGFLFGWHKKELYRLPSVSINNKKYGIKKLNLIDIGNTKGYRLKKDKFTVTQCVEMTRLIEEAVKTYEEKNIPLIKSM
jgi:hypothetical protein